MTVEPTLACEFATACRDAWTWPVPGSGRTGLRFDLLVEEARRDLVIGRLVEAHADALAIASELRYPSVEPNGRWGVWAAGAGDAVVAAPGPDGWRLHGTRAWCSGAPLVDHALVTAAAPDGPRLFAVTIASEGVTVLDSHWMGAGMRRAETRAVSFEAASAEAVGGPGDYLSRPGFWAGAIGVAACWHGGTLAVAAPLLARARSRPEPHLLAHLGSVHAAIVENRAVLGAAAAAVDHHPHGQHGATALAVRAAVERNAVDVIDRVGRALGPEPLAYDGRHATLVGDLAVYVRQHHAERDLAELGGLVAATDDAWE